jgi:hypothetical protein
LELSYSRSPNPKQRLNTIQSDTNYKSGEPNTNHIEKEREREKEREKERGKEREEEIIPGIENDWGKQIKEEQVLTKD